MNNPDETKQRIAHALIDLSEKKPLNLIKVKDIAEAAGVSRVTFYHHFSDKFDLIDWIFNSEMDAIFQQYRAGETHRNCLIATLHVFAERPDFYRNALRNTHGIDSFRTSIMEHSLNLLQGSSLSTEANISERSRLSLLFRYYFYGSSGLMVDWLNAGMPESAEELVDIIIEGMPKALRPYIH